MFSNYYMGLIWNILEYFNLLRLVKFLVIFLVVVIIFFLIVFCIEILLNFKKLFLNFYDEVWFKFNIFVIVWFMGEYVICFISFL